MSSWREEQNGVPPWNECPKCHCGFRAWLQVWEDDTPRGKKGCRYFKCPNIDDDFKVSPFINILNIFSTYGYLELIRNEYAGMHIMEWIDTRPLGGCPFGQWC